MASGGKVARVVSAMKLGLGIAKAMKVRLGLAKAMKSGLGLAAGTKRTSYIPFLLNLETRLDVILVRLHFCETIPQARQLISHRKVCVNNGIVNITHFKVSHGDIISFKEDISKLRRGPTIWPTIFQTGRTKVKAPQLAWNGQRK